MKKSRIAVAAAAALVALPMAFVSTASAETVANTPSSPTSDNGTIPYISSEANPGGNVTCADLEFDFGSGRTNYNNGDFDAEFPGGISVEVTEGKFVSFSSTFLIGAVIVKGSDDANVYDYRPAGSLGDSGLASPTNASGGPAGLSNLTFCWDQPDEVTEALVVTKTLDEAFTRTYAWDIDKSVNQSVFNLYTDGSGNGTATWTLDVQDLGPTDSAWTVSGKVKIENVGDLAANITNITDTLTLQTSPGVETSQNVTLTCPGDFSDLVGTLPVDGILECTYSVALDGAYAGSNTASVTTERTAYSVAASDVPSIDWSQAVVTEVDKTVTVTDVSEITALGTGGTQQFGPFTAGTPIVDPTYQYSFNWADYGQDGCGSYEYENTATLYSGTTPLADDDESVTVNVQCFVFDGETAWAANGNTPLQLRYTNRGNWATYVDLGSTPADKTTTLFAGQTLNAGSVEFDVQGINTVITVSLGAAWDFEDVGENLKVQTYTSAPRGNPEPGLFTYKKTCDEAASSCAITVPTKRFVGVHVNVGQWVPDPNFP
jgi:hypothetical protein